jgi:hypothetical protein
MMLSNLLAIAAASDLRAEIVPGFVDWEIDAVLGVDGSQGSRLRWPRSGPGAPEPDVAARNHQGSRVD